MLCAINALAFSPNSLRERTSIVSSMYGDIDIVRRTYVLSFSILQISHNLVNLSIKNNIYFGSGIDNERISPEVVANKQLTYYYYGIQRIYI